MRIIVDRSQFLKSLGHVHRVVERRNTIPILANILINARNNQVELKATDLDLEVTEITTASIEKAGGTTVPAQLLYDIMRKLPEGSQVALCLEDDGKAMAAVAGHANFRLQALPIDDFPQTKSVDFSHSFLVPAAGLKRLLDATHFAISTEETRYYLTGIYFHVVEEEGRTYLRMVAADGHRLAQAQIEAPIGSEGMKGVIIPRKTVHELQKLLGEEGDSDVRIDLSEGTIRLHVGAVILVSKLIDGTFPEYQKIIPISNSKEMVIDRQSLVAAVDRVAILASDRGRAIKLSLTSGQLRLLVDNPESGHAEDQLPVEYTDAAFDIGFNSRYLLDIIMQLSGDEAVFSFGEPMAPCLIRGKDSLQALYVLMPMRI
ncbi:DNA polymerase III subunit beta [Bartonella sp. DGB2]|uniref:DNA polymerase III subunit beta n=1 Tax=Bartonella sp. DGB2 TaxID=3388426 RepID=UPI00398F90A0